MAAEGKSRFTRKGLVLQVKQSRFGRFWRILGPGLITGAADDDPSGIATYSQAGAQFGYTTAWLMPLTLPLMTAVQEACARIGAVTGKGLAAVIRLHYGRKVLYPVVLLVVVANTINIGANIGAMAAATRLIVPTVSFTALALLFALVVIFFELFVSYRTLAKSLKWLAITLLAYPLTAFIVQIPWDDVIKATLIPRIEFSIDYLFIFVAVLGTTISPYLFFWQTSEVVEEEIASHRLAQKGGVPRLSAKFLRNLKTDNVIGMVFSNVTAFFIILTGAAVLHANGITQINSAADAARALEPLVQGFPNAGLISKGIFAVGIIGLGLLAVPVLAGSSSYALSEALGWQEGLFRKLRQAKGFYTIIALGTLLGLTMNLIGIDPIKALVFTAVFNGLAAVPLVFLIARLSQSSDVVGVYTGGLLSRIVLAITFIIMSLAASALLVSFVLS
ncbi:MAG TPA: divalent metal cation transporter [Candidatus Dormibacteraeota bacterium]|nr:divalent metal cation transporter [Candidatus Dormibacteraeota bacterium]